MKYLNIVQCEFVKEARKWDELSEKEQKEYLKKHPKSKRRLTVKHKQKSTLKEILNQIHDEFERKWEKKHPTKRVVKDKKKKNTSNNVIDDIKDHLSGDYDSWKEFVDSQELGDCQGIAHDIARKFGLKRVFGEIDVDESYIDNDGEEQNKVTHHWVEMNGEIYDFAKGSLSDYIEFADKYDPEVEDVSIYHGINKV